MFGFKLIWIPLFPLCGALINLLFGRRLSRQMVHIIACFSVFLSLCVAVSLVAGGMWHDFQAGAVPGITEHVTTWIEAGSFKVDLAFTLDTLSAVMVLTITFVGFLIHVYSTGYMAHDPRYATYFGYLNLFTGAMLILVLGDSLPVMFIGWEGVGLCSFLLIGFWFDKEKNANAGRKAFIVNRIGDFAFLLGIFVLYRATGQLTHAGIAGATSGLSPPLAFAGALLLFIGACGKSAQIPLYVWLPDAMAGPTPVSALIHAATMVTAGVYMVARLGVLYLAAPQVMMIVAGVGALTALFAALIGFAQTDIKKVLAYSTISQLGFMFAAVGTGAFGAGVFHLLTHAFFKAGLFLAAGSVMHAMGDRTEIMEMGGLRKKLPTTHATFLIYCLAIAGIFPFAGFFSKDEILLAVFAAHIDGWPAMYGKLLWIVLATAAMGTAFYMWRLYFLVFAGKSRAAKEVRANIHESPASMTGPLVILAIGATALGALGVPHVLGGHNWFAGWLSSSTPAHSTNVSVATEWGLMGLALVLAAVGIGVAYLFYKDGPGWAIRKFALAFRPVRMLLANKFYVDELYELAIVRPFRWIATATYNVVDRLLIDFIFVSGTAFVVIVCGRIARMWQNGDAQRYLATLFIGVSAMLYFTMGTGPSIQVSGTGLGRTFVADVDDAPKDARVSWDFDSDGKPDASGHTINWVFPGPGEYKVVMHVLRAKKNQRTLVSRRVTVNGGQP